MFLPRAMTTIGGVSAIAPRFLKIDGAVVFLLAVQILGGVVD
jgi:hypothetical protein